MEEPNNGFEQITEREKEYLELMSREGKLLWTETEDPCKW